MNQPNFSFWDSKKLVVFLVAAMAIFACVQSDKQAGDSTATTVSGANGKEVYSLYCAACHGEDGKLMMNEASDLSISKLSLDERIALIQKGKGLMVPYTDILSKEEIEAVAKYTQKLVTNKKGS